MSSHATTTGPQRQPAADLMFDGVFAHSLDFRIEMDYEVARQFIRRIDSYNEFTAAEVLDALDAVDALLPRKHFGEGNPNNGQRDFSISVGREGSPVLYLERLEWGDKEQLSDDRLKLICQEMQLTAKADEADYSVEPFCLSNGRKITFRFWWD